MGFNADLDQDAVIHLNGERSGSGSGSGSGSWFFSSNWNKIFLISSFTFLPDFNCLTD